MSLPQQQTSDIGRLEQGSKTFLPQKSEGQEQTVVWMVTKSKNPMDYDYRGYNDRLYTVWTS